MVPTNMMTFGGEVGSHAPSDSSSQVRVSTIPACVNCRKSKVKCHGEIPCARCVRLCIQSTCVRCTPQKRGRKRKAESLHPVSAQARVDTSKRSEKSEQMRRKRAASDESSFRVEYHEQTHEYKASEFVVTLTEDEEAVVDTNNAEAEAALAGQAHGSGARHAIQHRKYESQQHWRQAEPHADTARDKAQAQHLFPVVVPKGLETPAGWTALTPTSGLGLTPKGHTSLLLSSSRITDAAMHGGSGLSSPAQQPPSVSARGAYFPSIDRLFSLEELAQLASQEEERPDYNYDRDHDHITDTDLTDHKSESAAGHEAAMAAANRGDYQGQVSSATLAATGVHGMQRQLLETLSSQLVWWHLHLTTFGSAEHKAAVLEAQGPLWATFYWFCGLVCHFCNAFLRASSRPGAAVVQLCGQLVENILSVHTLSIVSVPLHAKSFDVTPLGVVLLRPKSNGSDGSMEAYVNPAACKLLGRSESALRADLLGADGILGLCSAHAVTEAKAAHKEHEDDRMYINRWCMKTCPVQAGAAHTAVSMVSSDLRQGRHPTHSTPCCVSSSSGSCSSMPNSHMAQASMESQRRGLASAPFLVSCWRAEAGERLVFFFPEDADPPLVPTPFILPITSGLMELSAHSPVKLSS